jgi:putative hydrolase of the HAD superfamily
MTRNHSIQWIIFDLSEVLIRGLVGIEKELARELSLPKKEILPAFGGEWLEELVLGAISEETYLRRIVAREGWQIELERLKAVIRDNFRREVPGTRRVLMDLAPRYGLALHSDHAREWIEYIRSVHPFLQVFGQMFFSFDLKRTKKEPEAFLAVLQALAVSPRRCLFIDDNPQNVSVAESVGIPSVLFVDSEQLATELKEADLILGGSALAARGAPRKSADAGVQGLLGPVE